MLLGKDHGRGEEGHLLAAHHGLEGRAEGDLRLAIAHVTADKAIHDLIALHIALDLIDAPKLVGSLGERERRLELYLPVLILIEGIAA